MLLVAGLLGGILAFAVGWAHGIVVAIMFAPFGASIATLGAALIRIRTRRSRAAVAASEELSATMKRSA